LFGVILLLTTYRAMGRSQVLYNRTAARMRANRGGRGREGGRGNGGADDHQQQRHPGQAARSAAASRRQHTTTPPPQALPPEAEQELTKEQAAAAKERRREQEAEQMMLMSQATSQYVSQQRSVVRDEDEQGGAHFVHSTPSSEMESLCSNMARALEFGLTRSEQLRMPAHLVETVYGREAAQRRRPPSAATSSSSPTSSKKSTSNATEKMDVLAARREAVASPAPSHHTTLHVTESMEPVLEVSSASSTFDNGNVFSHPVAAAVAGRTKTTTHHLNSNAASVEVKTDDMNKEADEDAEVGALMAEETSSTHYAPHPLNAATNTSADNANTSSVDAVDGNGLHGELNSAVNSELTTTTYTYEDDETIETSNSVLPNAARHTTAAGELRAAAASPPHYMEPTVSSVLKTQELSPKSPPSGDSMEQWLDDLLASGDTGDEDDAE